jgi:hypothetical protein
MDFDGGIGADQRCVCVCVCDRGFLSLLPSGLHRFSRSVTSDATAARGEKSLFFSSVVRNRDLFLALCGGLLILSSSSLD